MPNGDYCKRRANSRPTTFYTHKSLQNIHLCLLTAKTPKHQMTKERHFGNLKPTSEQLEYSLPFWQMDSFMDFASSVFFSCAWEALARKPGNVRPDRDFRDLNFNEMLASGFAIAPILNRTRELGIGRAIHHAVAATRSLTRSNSNLGIILLLAPLCWPETLTVKTVSETLDAMTLEDSKWIFDAIQMAQPGGLGKANEQDVTSTPTLPIREIMCSAQDRDAIARQYANGYADIVAIGLTTLEIGLADCGYLEEAILQTQLAFLGELPDTLIARKRGREEAEESARLANAARVEWGRRPGPPFALPAYRKLQQWLEAEGNQRNPGATADLIAATLFWALRLNKISLATPFSRPTNG